jgi:hypothetical protein
LILRQALRGFGGVNKACFAQPPQCGTQQDEKGEMLGIETKKAIKNKKLNHQIIRNDGRKILQLLSTKLQKVQLLSIHYIMADNL